MIDERELKLTMVTEILLFLLYHIIIAVEGNIASGKSSIVTACGLLPYVQSELEPVEEWKRVVYNHKTYNVLRSFYNAPRERFLALQTKVAISFSRIYAKPHIQGTIQLFERQLLSAKCFAKADTFNQEDLAVLNELFDHLMEKGYNNLIPDEVLYLSATPENCFKRMTARGRPEEQHVTLEYLQKVHDAHESWLSEIGPTVKKVTRFNANKNQNQVLEDVVNYLKQINIENEDPNAWVT